MTFTETLRRPAAAYTVQVAYVDEDRGTTTWATLPGSFATEAGAMFAVTVVGNDCDGCRILLNGALWNGTPRNGARPIGGACYVDADDDFPF